MVTLYFTTVLINFTILIWGSYVDYKNGDNYLEMTMADIAIVLFVVLLGPIGLICYLSYVVKYFHSKYAKYMRVWVYNFNNRFVVRIGKRK